MEYVESVVERNIDMWFFIQFGGFSSLSVGGEHKINAVFSSSNSLLSISLFRLRTYHCS
jgi:hypothetical protein